MFYITRDGRTAVVPGPNKKPYRTKAQRAVARRMARRCADGAWRSQAPFSFHGVPGEFVWRGSVAVSVGSR